MTLNFNFEEVYTKRDDRGYNQALYMLATYFMKDDAWESDKDFGTGDGNYEFKLTIKGQYEMELDFNKLIKYFIDYGNELETENNKLERVIENIRFKVNQYIDEELENIE